MQVTEKISVPFSDLSWQWKVIEKKLMPELHRLFDNTEFCLGPAVERFEKEFADYLGAKYAIGVNNGTSALHLSLIAAGIKADDEVLIPSNTFIATAWAVLYLGAKPILCDVEESTGNIDINDCEKRITPKTKAIIPVHLYGQPADMKAVETFAKKHNLIIIEDACQAHGAYYGNKRAGTMGAFGCFSFYPGKNLGAFGEAGAIVTNDSESAKRLKALRQHGQYERYVHQEMGFNYRMEGIQGLVLSHKLKHLEDWTNERKEIAKQYCNAFSGLPLALPKVIHHDHVYHLFVIRLQERNALQQRLNSVGIMTGQHYPVPLHDQPCLQHLKPHQAEFPISDQYAKEGLSLPLFPGMSQGQIDRVIEEVISFFR